MVARGTLNPLAQVRTLARQPKNLYSRGKIPLVNISVRKPETTDSNQLVIDIVVKLPPIHYLTCLKYDGGGLYDVPPTWKEGLDTHTSYEASGEMHSKLTRGNLMIYPGGQLLGKTKPKTNGKEIVLWQRKGQPWHSLKGIERCGPLENGAWGFFNIKPQAEGCHIYDYPHADYVYEIDAQSLPCEMVDIEYFLVEPENISALQECVKKIIDSWVWPNELMTVERVELFANRSPWLAIVLFSKRAKGSESLLRAQPF